jgi:lipopolysaccharide/colanic/teichoic acid biosynthesis glycosyltransferase
MKGFVQKNGRLTKGGSLPLGVGARKLGRLLVRYLSGENGSNGRADRAADMTLSRSGSTAPQNGSHVRSPIPPIIKSRNGAKSLDGKCPPLLEKLIVEHVVSERTESPRSGVNGDSPAAPLSGNGASSYSRLAHDSWATSLLEAELENVVPAFTPQWKRLLDLTCIGITLPFWLPLMILVMLWVKVVSPGPVFFRQARVGYRRRQFMIFKFRTMRVNAETQTHAEYVARLMREDCPMTKLDGGDPRLIACGRFLRASGLDELPQIFNVIWGDMSLVGPRPCLPHEFDWYEGWQQQRVNVLPGLTGYWQVNGKNHTTFSEMIAMDIFYSQNMSLWLDLAIIFKTVPALITQTVESRGASRIFA